MIRFAQLAPALGAIVIEAVLYGGAWPLWPGGRLSA
jgi:hypothetical protein